jgi:hypothetical protein
MTLKMVINGENMLENVILIILFFKSPVSKFMYLYLDYWSLLRSNGQSSWLEIQRFRFDSRRYHIFWEVAGRELGPLSLMSTTEELLERKNSGFGLEIKITALGDLPRWLHYTPLSAKIGISFADKRRSHGQYSSLSHSGYGVCLFLDYCSSSPLILSWYTSKWNTVHPSTILYC